MYCVYCGVKLQSGVEKCPLCGTRVTCPDVSEERAAPPYPPYADPGGAVKRRAVMLIVTVLALIPAAVCFLIDMSLHSAVTWSGYAMGGVALAYISFCLPGWFRRPEPAVFFPVAAAAALGYLLYISASTGGGWFLSFAFPIGGALALLTECVIVLLRYVARGRPGPALVIMGGASIVLGGLMILIEFMLHVTFDLKMTWWSLIPLSALALVGALLLTIGLAPPLRRALHKRFFI